MHIIHITSELAPIAKVGGLADVVYGLAQELARLGHTVEIVLPKYDCLHYEQLRDLKVEFRELWSFEGPYRFNNTIWSATLAGLKVYLIEPHHPQYFFSRGVIYGCRDDIDRFVYFARTALEFLFKANKQPDAIHVHDWPTALIPVLYKEIYLPLGYQAGGTVMTIHNMEHQGKCTTQNISKIGLRGETYLTPDTMQDPYAWDHVNLLKGGIVYADQITTVSPTYIKEIQTPEGGFGLQDTLIKHRHKLTGILNGIDEDFWNPATDTHLIQRYNTHDVNSEEQLDHILKAKNENKRQLRTHLRLKDENRPLVASVTRLVPQKGPELIKHAILHTLEIGGQFALLGSASNPMTAHEFEELKLKLLHHGQAAVLIDKDETLAHLIFASADMFIIPSLFEPCGLTQMISLRYGTVPIARVTGGLADTVHDIDTSARPLQERNGFTFDYPDLEGVNWALGRAITCYKTDPKKWRSIIRNGINMDYSWKHTAQDYVKVYEKLKRTDTSKNLKLA